MANFVTTHLADCLSRYQFAIPGLADLDRRLGLLTSAISRFPRPLGEGGEFCDESPSPQPSPIKGEGEIQQALIDLYEQCYPLLEKAMWSAGSDFAPLLACYQALFREQEALIRQRGGDDRHHFILSIPVADRPPHLRACLESIYQVCTLFNYGGNASGVWDKIKIIVAEDSRDEINIRRHLELVEEYRHKGLQVFHFGLDEQYDLLQSLPPHQREQLGHLLTTQPREKFYRKGQAANRNLSYLKFLQLTKNRDRTLYYLVDSDQHFCVNRQTEVRRRSGVCAELFPRHRQSLPHHRHPDAHRQDGGRPARLALGDGGQFPRRRDGVLCPPGHAGRRFRPASFMARRGR